MLQPRQRDRSSRQNKVCFRIKGEEGVISKYSDTEAAPEPGQGKEDDEQKQEEGVMAGEEGGKPMREPAGGESGVKRGDGSEQAEEGGQGAGGLGHEGLEKAAPDGQGESGSHAAGGAGVAGAFEEAAGGQAHLLVGTKAFGLRLDPGGQGQQGQKSR